jgi:hypothetical protein
MVMRTLRRQLDQLPRGKIYLDAPTEMKVSDKRTVDARVGVNAADDILRGTLGPAIRAPKGRFPWPTK